MSSALNPSVGASGRVPRVLFTLLMLGSIVFIFGNSSQTGIDSAVTSARVTDLLNRIVARLGIGFVFTEGLVRKLAHFAEFMMLGFWTMLTLRVYTRNILGFICWPLFIGLSVAVLDELYQHFVPGRASSVMDVAIDFAGVVVGLCVALFLQLLVGAILRMVRQRKTGVPV